MTGPQTSRNDFGHSRDVAEFLFESKKNKVLLLFSVKGKASELNALAKELCGIGHIFS